MRFFGFALLFFLSVSSFAQEEYLAGPLAAPTEALRAFDEMPVAPAIQSSEREGDLLYLVYDPREWSADAAEMAEAEGLRQRLALLVGTSGISGKDYIVPEAPSTSAGLDSLRDLSARDIQIFLVKKEKFLNKLSAWLRWLRLPRALHNRVLRTMNDRFFQSAALIAKANSQGGLVRFQGGAGFGLRSQMVEKLRTTKLGSWLPSSGGFFLSFGFGASLSRVDQDGRRFWALEFFADASRLSSVKTYVLEAFAGLSFNYLAQREEEARGRIANLRATIQGPVGTVTEGKGFFSYGPSLVLGFPPLQGSLLFYELKIKRFRLARFQFGGLAAGGLCRQIF